MAADLTTTTPSSPTSPNFHRKILPSPWTQVVRGQPDPARTTLSPDKETVPMNPPAVTEVVAAVVNDESSDCSNDNVAKKSAWRSVNGVVEAGTVMGGAAWPTITESTRACPKVSPSFSKPSSDASISVSQEQVISHAPQKEATANGHHNNSNHTHKQTHRRKYNKKGGNAGVGSGHGSGQNSFSRPPGPPPPPPPPPFPIPFGNLLPPRGMELPIREPSPYPGTNLDTRPIGGGGVGYHSHDHPSQRHPSRRGNFGPRPRGDGGYNNGYGIRRDQDREWNASGRDIHINPMVPPPPPPPPRGLTRPALPGPMPYIPSRHVRPFGNSMPFDMVPPFLYVPPMPPDSYRGVPLVLPPPHLYFPVIDPNVRMLLLNQIDYYFSDTNLVKDDFLRSHMDDQGWVSITLIANFRRVSKLTTDVQLILDTLGASTVVEVQGDKIRKRENWSKWIPSVGQISQETSLQSQSQSSDAMLATSIQEVRLDEVTSDEVTSTDKTVEYSDAEPRRVVSSDEPITQSELAKGLRLAEASSEGCT